MLLKFKRVTDSEGNENIPSLLALVDSSVDEKDGSVIIRPYSQTEGFHQVLNPGWIKFELEKPETVSYIRLHLWDSCGNGKQQPSHREYQYRLLVSSSDDPMDPSAEWNVIYDTMSKGSNGWQEFYKEGDKGFGTISGIMIHTMDNSRNAYTHVIELQASKYPTLGIAEEFGIDIDPKEAAPKIHRIINNRVICGSEHEASLTQEIFGEIKEKLKKLKKELNTDVLEELIKETDQHMTELNTLDTELKNLTASLIKPVNNEFEAQGKTEHRMKWISRILFILALSTMIYDVVRMILEIKG